MDFDEEGIVEYQKRVSECRLYTIQDKNIKQQVRVVYKLSKEVRDVIAYLNGLCELDRFNQATCEKQDAVLKTLVGVRKSFIKISAQVGRLQREERERHTEEEEKGWRWIKLKIKKLKKNDASGGGERVQTQTEREGSK